MQYACGRLLLSPSPCRRRLLDTKQLFFRQKKMSFHFASSEYASCFQNLPKPNVPKIRESAIQYLDSFNKNEWYNDPVSIAVILSLPLGLDQSLLQQERLTISFIT